MTSDGSVQKTVLITGCSSGYGLETARHFHSQGWDVIATMRAPREDVLHQSERLRVVALDVTKPESIAAALEASGPIDVLVNNAGIGPSAPSRPHRWPRRARSSRPTRSA
jgi:NAD(P)-dependent dehydrogenase (short-subunit alcohol dehydrogenase family)